MEIERKFLPSSLPEDLDQYPHIRMSQAYLCTAPVVRVRREGEAFVLTYKGSGMLSREEVNLPLTEEAFLHLLEKADGKVIEKTRYRVPLTGPYSHLTAEIDLFSGAYEGLRLLEVEFSDLDEAESFIPPAWFGEEVTYSEEYHNSYMSQH